MIAFSRKEVGCYGGWRTYSSEYRLYLQNWATINININIFTCIQIRKKEGILEKEE
jgi:hypothetical protein